MTIAPAQGPATGNPGIVPPWLQGGDRPVAPPATASAEQPPKPGRGPDDVPPPGSERRLDALIGIPTRDGIVIVDVPDGILGREELRQPTSGRRGSGAVDAGRRGATIAAEQARIDDTVRRIQSRFRDLGITDREGNSPVTAVFRPDFPNAAFAPDGLKEHGLPRDSIGVGIDPRSGRSFAEADDVVAHELAHRVIFNMTDRPLSMHPMSEDVAIQETLADTFAALVDDDDPWTLGEELAEPVRSMDRPERLGHPGHVKDLETVLAPGSPHMVPVGHDRRTGKVVTAPDWHVVAGIPNKAAAIIGTQLGRDTLGKIYLKAVRDYVQPGAEVEGLAAAVLRSTKDLYGAGSRELRVATDAWDAVGVLDLIAPKR